VHAEVAGMQLRIPQVLLCAFFVCGQVLTASADPTDELSTLFRPVSNSQQVSSIEPVKVTKETHPSKPAMDAPKAPRSLRDLFLKSKPAKPKDRHLEKISVEPWMPGRGSLGVQLQVTW
jgi:hypothetical protein